ncbi:DNA-dependent RNA polymerase II [Marasmius sp. AFHP31]|nr:DNA-dependent RNA polymerase II [Marasmius sp. AFHP31]
MEPDCMICHGLAGFLNERLFEARDGMRTVCMCDMYGLNLKKQNFESRACKNKAAVYQLYIPYAVKLLFRVPFNLQPPCIVTHRIAF